MYNREALDIIKNVSETFKLMKNASESLAGRVRIINLNSFTYSDIMQNKKRNYFIQFI